MKERPILFSGAMVNAILSGKKTQTRRIVRDVPKSVEGVERQIAARTCVDAEPGTHFFRWLVPGGISAGFMCPYGQPGHLLWVRETWTGPVLTTDRGDLVERYFYCATDKQRVDHRGNPIRWRPSIHMPRAVSRITLEVTGVRVERLHAITEEDAQAEGVDDGAGRGGHLYPSHRAARSPLGYRERFHELWDVINGKRAAWKTNPWVFVIAFRRIKP